MKPLRYYLPERLRWRIVQLVDRLPGQCWSRLCDWAGTWSDEDPDGFRTWPWWAPWRPDQSGCRDDVAWLGAAPVDLDAVCADHQVVEAVLADDLDHARSIAPRGLVDALVALRDHRRAA